jgi:hypothetical protein
MISSEEGRWKRAARHLAGGLSYGTHGFEAEVEGAIRPSTVTIHKSSRWAAELLLPGRGVTLGTVFQPYGLDAHVKGEMSL